MEQAGQEGSQVYRVGQPGMKRIAKSKQETNNNCNFIQVFTQQKLYFWNFWQVMIAIRKFLLYQYEAHEP